MQDPKNSHTRKPWYQRAIERATVWKTVSKTGGIPTTNARTLWKTISRPTEIPMANATLWKAIPKPADIPSTHPNSSEKLRKSDVPPRRSNSYPRSKPFPLAQERAMPSVRLSTEGRRVFRGKSLTDDVLMRRFVVEEEAMMQVRRRNQMEVIRKRSLMRRKMLGPSPLSRMVKADEDENF
ncbi:TBC1 domain family member 22B [Hibiscus syriacus]|uniref:TBC1 domain family member 22B n=1 Tax=Hibiscus syriacus TaxID=106335 RepID=A0A6A2Y0V5_HIBSY|nr:TBC1 domain family member 22B [Hibiscus syriacus]